MALVDRKEVSSNGEKNTPTFADPMPAIAISLAKKGFVQLYCIVYCGGSNFVVSKKLLITTSLLCEQSYLITTEEVDRIACATPAVWGVCALHIKRHITRL